MWKRIVLVSVLLRFGLAFMLKSLLLDVNGHYMSEVVPGQYGTYKGESTEWLSTDVSSLKNKVSG